MSRELTPWYPKRSKPARIGWYQTDASKENQAYQYWTGQHFGLFHFSPSLDRFDRQSKSSHQNVQWRGLTRRAK